MTFEQTRIPVVPILVAAGRLDAMQRLAEVIVALDATAVFASPPPLASGRLAIAIPLDR